MHDKIILNVYHAMVSGDKEQTFFSDDNLLAFKHSLVVYNSSSFIILPIVLSKKKILS